MDALILALALRGTDSEIWAFDVPRFQLLLIADEVTIAPLLPLAVTDPVMLFNVIVPLDDRSVDIRNSA